MASLKHRGSAVIAALVLFGALQGCDRPPAQASIASVAPAPAQAHPLCDLASLAEVQAVIGGRVEKRDVMDDAGMPIVDCLFLDADDVFNGLSLRILTTARLQANDSPWANAKAYFDEWSRNGEPVAGIGDGAAWIDMPASLMVWSGDRAFHLSGGKLDLADLQVRARLEELARRIASRG